MHFGHKVYTRRSGGYPAGPGAAQPHDRDRGPGVLPLLGPQGGISGVLWGHLLLASLKQKSGNGVSGEWRLGGPLPSLVVLLMAVSYSWQHTHSRWRSFEMDTLA